MVRPSLRHGHHLNVIELQLKADIELTGRTLLDYFRDVESLGLLIAAATTLNEGGLSEAVANELTCPLLFATAIEPDLLLSAFNLPADRLICSAKAVWTEWLATQPSLVPAASFALSTPPRLAAEVTPQPPKTIMSTPSTVPVPVDPASAGGPAARVKTEDTVRISVSLLDALMNLAGEMVLGRNQLLRIAAPARGGVGYPGAGRARRDCAGHQRRYHRFAAHHLARAAPTGRRPIWTL